VGKSVKAKVIEGLPPRVQDALTVVRMAKIGSELTLPSRIRLLMVAPRLITRRARSTDLRLMLSSGPVYLGGDSLYIDALVFDYLWHEGVFNVSCQDRVVLDLGAHKGYFGAWALNHGASFVISCEPESSNYHVLERTRSENVRSGDWEVMRIAVGATAGEVSLFLSPESWAHSIYADMIDAVSVERVAMVTLETLLDRAAEKRPGKSVVVKANVEGSAGPILMAATADSLASVAEVHLDYEQGSPYAIDEVFRHLAAAGLDEVHNVVEGKKWTVSRSGEPEQLGSGSASRHSVEM
jgi:FkbM family methyltransferase